MLHVQYTTDRALKRVAEFYSEPANRPDVVVIYKDDTGVFTIHSGNIRQSGTIRPPRSLLRGVSSHYSGIKLIGIDIDLRRRKQRQQGPMVWTSPCRHELKSSVTGQNLRRQRPIQPAPIAIHYEKVTRLERFVFHSRTS